MLIVSRKSRSSGFSLIELIVGLSMLAILLSVAIPSFQNWMLNAQIRNAAESIQNGLQRARAEAVKRNTNVEFALTDATTSWLVQLPGGGGGLNGDPIDFRNSTEGSVSVVRTTLPKGSSTVTFNSVGGVEASVDRLTVVKLSLDTAKLPAQNAKDLWVVIGTGGVIRMCDPHSSNAATAC